MADRPPPSLRYLRIAVTSRCNLRCVYCRPESGAEGADVLSRDELARFVRLAVACGIEKVRVTGGEPLLRPDIIAIVRDLAATPGLRDLGLTTNGTLLGPLAAHLAQAGLRRINIGIPALTPEVYQRVTRGGRVEDALSGLRAALDAGFRPVKVNVVVMRGVNDAEVPALAGLTRERDIEVRFIEYMPFTALERAPLPDPSPSQGEGRVRVSPQPNPPPAPSLKGRGVGGTGVPPVTQPVPNGVGGTGVPPVTLVVPAEEVLARLRQLGELEPLPGRPGAAAARRFRIAGHAGTVGIIAPHSEPFCHACNRVRLTADGRLRACLIEGGEIDILPQIRAGLDRATLQRLLSEAAAAKPALHRGSFRGEMHRIGG